LRYNVTMQERKAQLNNPKVGQFVIIAGETFCVTEECDVLKSFWATNTDGDEEEFHTSQIDAICP